MSSKFQIDSFQVSQAVALPALFSTPPQPLPRGDSVWKELPLLLPVGVASLPPRQIPNLPTHLPGQTGPHDPHLLHPVLPRSVGLVKGLLRGTRGWRTRASTPIHSPPAASQPSRPDRPSPWPPCFHADGLTPWTPQTTNAPLLPPLPPAPLPGPTGRGPWGPWRRPSFAQPPAPATTDRWGPAPFNS